MNYNISNSNGSAQFLSLKPQNKLTEGQIVLQLISTALKHSLAVYELHWKPEQILSKIPNLTQDSSGLISSSFIPEKKKTWENEQKILQQNKKSIQKISNSSKIQKNKKIQLNNRQNHAIWDDKICSQQHKLTAISTEHPKAKRQKVIHQKLNKLLTPSKANSFIENASFIDLHQPAYLPKNQLSSREIREIREKLLLRKVISWKQIDKKLGFRKMELKKLLS